MTRDQWVTKLAQIQVVEDADEREKQFKQAFAEFMRNRLRNGMTNSDHNIRLWNSMIADSKKQRLN